MENKLSFLRKNKVLSQREVASLIGKEARFIHRLENGKVKILLQVKSINYLEYTIQVWKKFIEQ